jgi:hypothetical protein
MPQFLQTYVASPQMSQQFNIKCSFKYSYSLNRKDMMLWNLSILLRISQVLPSGASLRLIFSFRPYGTCRRLQWSVFTSFCRTAFDLVSSHQRGRPATTSRYQYVRRVSPPPFPRGERTELFDLPCGPPIAQPSPELWASKSVALWNSVSQDVVRMRERLAKIVLLKYNLKTDVKQHCSCVS